MTFVTCVYVPDGIVIASDSRQTIDIKMKLADGAEKNINTIGSDSINKTFIVKDNIGITHCGDTLLGGVSTESHIKKFQEEKLNGVNKVIDVAMELKSYFKSLFPNARTSFYVTGFEKNGNISTPFVYETSLQGNDGPKRLNFSDAASKVIYGCAWGGEGDIMAKFLQPRPAQEGRPAIEFPIIYDAMSLQDAIDFATFLIRTTIDTIRFQARPKTVGGPIDVLLITPAETRWICRKKL